MGKSVNIDMEKFHVLYNQGLSDNKIAKELGCDRKTIERRRHKLGLPVNFWQSEVKRNPELIKQMLEEGKSSVEISKLLNVSVTTLAKFKKEKGIKGAYDAKMSKEDIDKAMSLAQEGYMDTEIAELFGVTAGNIMFHRKNRGIESQFTYDKISKINNKKFEELFNQGLGDEEIGKALGISSNGVYYHRIRHGYFRRSFKENELNPLTQDNLEIILGIMMGDGSMEHTYKNAKMSIAHGEKQKEYSYYIADKLSNLNPHTYVSVSKLDERTGKRYTSYWVDLPANPAFNEICDHFYVNRIKRIPIELFDNFTWQSLAYMFMDDGSKAHCGGQLATNCFTIEDLQKFQDFLLRKFNIETTICKRHTLYIKAKSFRHMKSHIEPYMCECTKYKIR
nr:MAG TPA: endonuclease [Crassvirales sp.]